MAEIVVSLMGLTLFAAFAAYLVRDTQPPRAWPGSALAWRRLRRIMRWILAAGFVFTAAAIVADGVR
jgi:hypothetical protein